VIVFLETDQLSQMSASVELARQKMQEAYDKSRILAQLKEEEVCYFWKCHITFVFLYRRKQLFFLQEKEKKRQKILKILEKKNVGRKLGSNNSDTNETPSTSTKSKPLKSGKI